MDMIEGEKKFQIYIEIENRNLTNKSFAIIQSLLFQYVNFLLFSIVLLWPAPPPKKAHLDAGDGPVHLDWEGVLTSNPSFWKLW